jgi:hypothetical protein
MNVRRTSGEIVNATLLEIFLTLVFLIFGLAAFEQQRAEAAIAAKNAAPSPHMLDSLRVLADSVQREQRAKADSLRVLSMANDSLRDLLISKYPPDCEPNAGPAEWLTVTLIGPDQLHVLVNRTEFGLVKGGTLDLTAESFVRRFAAVHAKSERLRCRYVVQINDTRATNKEEFKHAVSEISSVFRARNFLR